MRLFGNVLKARFAAPARSPTRPPIKDTLWEAGWGSGLAPP